MVPLCKRQILLIALFFILANQATCRELHGSTMEERYGLWMAEHGKAYKNAEEKLRRFQIFESNVEFIESFNAAGHNLTYKLGINIFADISNEEFRASWTGHKRPVDSPRTVTPFKYENVTSPPSTVDWTKKGVVTSVKDQGMCGSCWAFSAIGATEAIHKLSKGDLISLSEQEILDCDVKGNDEGCNGGLMQGAFKFIMNNHGVTSELNYPYKGVKGTCDPQKVTSGMAKITGYENVPANSEQALMKAVANQPVSVSIDASDKSFQFYQSGVYTGECGTNLNHGVLAVGYGRSDSGAKYWLVKNSWGGKWGENGYVRMEKDIKSANGLCGIAMDCSYPNA